VISRGLAKTFIEKVPGKVLIEINKRVGFRLLTTAGEKGAINLMRGVPLVGGVVGGTFDAVACRVVGGNARALFARRPQRTPKKPRTARPRATRTRVRAQRTTSAEKNGVAA
jgi:hypothetical protein